MGFLDNLLGSAAPGGNLSKPLGIAMLALAAYQAAKGGGLFGGNNADQAMSQAAQQPQAQGQIAEGLGGLLQRFQQHGYGDVAGSWIANGPNQPIAPDQLHQALGGQTVDELSRQTGMPQQDVLSQLSQMLPQFIDRLTPQGRIPQQADLSRV